MSLADALKRARAAYPDVTVDEGTIASHLADRIEDDLPPERVAELYLAAAAAHGDARAVAHLEREYFTELGAALGRMNLSDAMLDEVKQGLRKHLFVADGRPLPHIADFNGSGPLGAWLRVSATRAALKLLKRGQREVQVADDDVLLDRSAPDEAPELKQFKQRYGPLFKEAFVEAIGSLEDREKNLLRQHFVDGLTIDELEPIYHVHRATVARWIGKARETMLKRTRKILMKKTGVTPTECDSILRAVQSQFDLTLRGLLP